MVKNRKFTAVFGPGSSVKLRHLQSPRAAAILRQLSNWRTIEDTEGQLWSGMESKHGARILTVRIPETNFFAIVRMWDNHKAYERALAKLKSGEGKTIEGYQREAGEFWGREGMKWLVFDEEAKEWLRREEWNEVMAARAAREAEEKAAREAAREAAKMAARQGMVVEAKGAVKVTEVAKVTVPSKQTKTPKGRKAAKWKKFAKGKKFAKLEQSATDTQSDSDKQSDREEVPLTPPTTPELKETSEGDFHNDNDGWLI